jgi:hypothetical protein
MFSRQFSDFMDIVNLAEKGKVKPMVTKTLDLKKLIMRARRFGVWKSGRQAS